MDDGRLAWLHRLSPEAEQLRCCIVGLLLIFAAWPAGFGAEKLAWRDAEVELSDGRTVAGQVALVNDQLIIHNEAQAKKYTVRLAEMKQFEYARREGIHGEEVVLQGGRPRRESLHRRGLSRALFQHARDVRRRAHARRAHHQHHGVSQSRRRRAGAPVPDHGRWKARSARSSTTSFTSSASRSRARPPASWAASAGRSACPRAKSWRRVIAINCQDDTSLSAELAGDGAFKFTDCTRGAYDLVVLSDRAIYAGFSAEKAADSARLGAETLKEISDWSKNVRDFFDSHDPLYGAGNMERAYVLVRMERARDRPNTLQADTMFRRYEVWLMAKPEDEWVIAEALPPPARPERGQGHPEGTDGNPAGTGRTEGQRGAQRV